LRPNINVFAISKLIRIFHTLRHLLPRQVAYQFLYRITGRLTKNNAARTQVRRAVEKQWDQPVRFSFLNLTVDFPSPANIDWNFAGHGKLWTYNLNYFEFLSDRSFAEGSALISAWIDGKHTHRDGWEPYPTSLRLVSWIQFYLDAGREMPPETIDSVRRQYESLWSKREFHLGGNHLLENALALSLTAHFLPGISATDGPDRLLITELAEQYLPDGAHYELSPMYHLTLLKRMLVVYDAMLKLGTISATKVPTLTTKLPSIVQTLHDSLTKQLGWAVAFCTPDGRYAHFNDSTDGIAPALADLRVFAAALAISPAPVRLGACGYRRWQHGPYDLWIDAAGIGPGYIPGHAHADNLTFELHLNGRPVIVDPAISTYEKNGRRTWERSTPAHNTVTLNDRNSSDVWGGFRVGRRANTTLEVDTETRLTASHNGYETPHRRTFESVGATLLITDEVNTSAAAVARFHFAHDLRVELVPAGCRAGDLLLGWEGGEASLKNYDQAVGWNTLLPAGCLEIKFANTLGVTIGLAPGERTVRRSKP